MLALQIQSMKTFMNKLLTQDAFDIFLLEEATISTAITYSIDGHINADFFPMAERTPELIPYEFRPWSEIRSLCYELIKGKYTPLSFKFVFQLKPEHVQSTLGKEHLSPESTKLKSMVLTVKYDGSKALLTSGTSYQTFVMDKTADVLWDRNLASYLTKKEIPYEIL